MIHVRLFRRYYLAASLIVLVFILLGYIATRLVTHLTSSAPQESHHPVFYAKLIDHLDPGHRDKALSEFMSWNVGGVPYRFEIVDRDGTVLYPSGETLPFNWNDIKKPIGDYGWQSIGDRETGHGVRALIRFSGQPSQYLYVSLERRGPGRPQWIFFSMYASLVVSVLLGIAFSMVLLFRSLRETAKQADFVLDQLQSGNLKARFRIGRVDELGTAMSRFNRMADEIERLVERLKSVEKSRMTLLQDLAHDLRTPVASLKNMLETILRRGGTMDPKIREELLNLSVREAEYFERLVEDLLVLAQVTEPRYRAGADRVALGDLVEEEAESVAAYASAEAGSKGQTPIELKTNIVADLPEVYGDPHLLRRMVRNALINAFSFAKSAVTVDLARGEGGELKLEVRDDGDGFSTEALSNFGERRTSRMLDSRHPDRLSVGLGSVIMRTVAQLHRGRVEARNVSEGGGACVTVYLPTSPATAA